MLQNSLQKGTLKSLSSPVCYMFTRNTPTTTTTKESQYEIKIKIGFSKTTNTQLLPHVRGGTNAVMCQSASGEVGPRASAYPETGRLANTQHPGHGEAASTSWHIHQYCFLNFSLLFTVDPKTVFPWVFVISQLLFMFHSVIEMCSSLVD